MYVLLPKGFTPLQIILIVWCLTSAVIIVIMATICFVSIFVEVNQFPSLFALFSKRKTQRALNDSLYNHEFFPNLPGVLLGSLL